MAVLCLFPNTPWPWSTPSRAASAGYGKSGRQAIPNRLFEECLGCGYISCPTGPEVDSLPSLVYCPIQIGPLSAYLEIGFIDSLRAASAAAKAIPPLDELWSIPSNPALDRRMGKLESSFGHHLHQITEAEPCSANTNARTEGSPRGQVPSCKQLFDVSQPAHCQSSITKTTLSDGISLFAPELARQCCSRASIIRTKRPIRSTFSPCAAKHPEARQQFFGGFSFGLDLLLDLLEESIQFGIDFKQRAVFTYRSHCVVVEVVIFPKPFKTGSRVEGQIHVCSQGFSPQYVLAPSTKVS